MCDFKNSGFLPKVGQPAPGAQAQQHVQIEDEFIAVTPVGGEAKHVDDAKIKARDRQQR